jgi:hypothetical protein
LTLGWYSAFPPVSSRSYQGRNRDPLLPYQLRRRCGHPGSGHPPALEHRERFTWVLDITFREDDSRERHRTAALNLALLRKIALNLVAADRSSQTSLRGRRKKAAWNDDYMLRIITRQAHA